ncbi:methyltransferase domain-containing protein [Patulibacter brassicae]|jgi:SAM-dependent methyltransferase|uniref:Methyltransferase domain-containing protein n=1 Tax=Patulibacter brassicae TaxID=1705717 RepID=A0ABU4VFH2_9ACTN|nr:methyltransferase domain-containing protein [Patulibacter brassicae]MDX8150581.1 methyltransferase domain-containing protein [Patulibacter brassicae]
MAEIDPNFPYGLDRPRQVRGLAGIGMLAGVLTLVAAVVVDVATAEAVVVLLLLATCIGAFLASALMFRTSRTTKIRAVDDVLDGLELRGDERALDLGCGSGLLCAGLAVRLPAGDVVGVDAWVEHHLQPNGKPLARTTLHAAGVKGVHLRTGSMRELPVEDGAVQLAVSRDALSLLPGPVARDEVVAELLRVVRPGGRVALLEPFVARDLAARLTSAGFTDVTVGPRRWSLMPPHRLVTARRP